MCYIPNVPDLYVGYNPLTNNLLTSWDIQVRFFWFTLSKNWPKIFPEKLKTGEIIIKTLTDGKRRELP